jgi:hypothetical protein
LNSSQHADDETRRAAASPDRRCPFASSRGVVSAFTSCEHSAALALGSYVPLPDLIRCSKERRYSITSSARTSRAAGTVTPSALAVLRLMNSSTRLFHW